MRALLHFFAGLRAKPWSARWRLVLGCFLLGALGAANAQTVFSPTKAFGIAYQANEPGDILIVGNTVMTCPTATAGCAGARTATSVATPIPTGATFNNNGYAMVNVDVDAAEPGLTSSTAGLQIPSGATVLWAGLYWGADSGSATRAQVKFRTPAGGYQTLTADWIANNGTTYHAAKTVTALVTAGGSGNYTVADVKTTATGGYGGWSLVVVYKLATEPFRNLTVFEGYNAVSTNPGPTIAISGFVTPPTGAVGARIGMVAYEGDLGTTGDRLQINGTDFGNTLNPFHATTAASRNPFNSSITRLGTRLSDKTPDYSNQLGFDIDVIAANGILANNATSANITLSSTGDVYYPGVVTTAIDIFVPNLTASLNKTVVDVNGGTLEPGDFLDYTISFTNTGQDIATKVFVVDPIPADTTYVPNSLQILTGANPGAKTDLADVDQAEFLTSPNRVRFRLGDLANGTAGGRLAPGASASFSFRVQVNPSTNGKIITNTATISYSSQTLGTTYTADKAVSIAVVSLPLLTHQKTVQVISDPINGLVNPKNIPGAVSDYTLTVSNTGPGSVDANTLALVDAVPANSELFTGNLVAGAPYVFTDGALSSGLTCPFAVPPNPLANFTDCVDFSSDGGTTWAYVPNGGYDPAVTHVRFRLTGPMNGDATAGAPYPGFGVKFRVRVK